MRIRIILSIFIIILFIVIVGDTFITRAIVKPKSDDSSQWSYQTVVGEASNDETIIVIPLPQTEYVLYPIYDIQSDWQSRKRSHTTQILASHASVESIVAPVEQPVMPVPEVPSIILFGIGLLYIALKYIGGVRNGESVL